MSVTSINSTKLRKFMDASSAEEIQDGNVHLVGFPFDGTACFRKGAEFGPGAIREVSYSLESYSPYLDLDLEDVSFVDLGDIDCSNNWDRGIETFEKTLKKIDFSKDQKVLTLGGEHSISYLPITAYLKEYPDLLLIHLDAHADLRDGYEGYHYSHASIMCRVLENFKSGHELVQFGIRSGTREEFEWMREHKTNKSTDEFFSIISKVDSNRPVYLTLDLDFFDPSVMPGTGTPEAGGESFNTFVKLIKILKTKKFVGGDVVELAPNIDSTGNSDVFAAKVVREMILAMSV